MSVTFDKILNKLRSGLSAKEAGKLASLFQPKTVFVTVDNTDTVDLTVSGGTYVTLANDISTVILNNPQNSTEEWTCIFTAGTASDPVVDIPASMSVVGEPSFEQGKSYIINVLDNILVSAEYTKGA